MSDILERRKMLDSVYVADCEKPETCPEIWISDAAAEIARLRKALFWYADAERYRYTEWQGDMDDPLVLFDKGNRASAALKGDT